MEGGYINEGKWWIRYTILIDSSRSRTSLIKIIYIPSRWTICWLHSILHLCLSVSASLFCPISVLFGELKFGVFAHWLTFSDMKYIKFKLPFWIKFSIISMLSLVFFMHDAWNEFAIHTRANVSTIFSNLHTWYYCVMRIKIKFRALVLPMPKQSHPKLTVKLFAHFFAISFWNNCPRLCVFAFEIC